MKKEYLVSVITTRGKTKNMIVEATSCKQADELASQKYPSYEVQRITCEEKDIRFFLAMKKMKKDKQ